MTDPVSAASAIEETEAAVRTISVVDGPGFGPDDALGCPEASSGERFDRVPDSTWTARRWGNV